MAARALRRAGLRLLGHRVQTRAGEVDLALRFGEVLVVCEVKSGRRAGRFRPRDRCRPRTLARRMRAARLLAIEAGLARCRVDIVEVLAPPGGRRARVLWSRGAVGSAERSSHIPRVAPPRHSL